MVRLKVIFATILLLIALPVWRFMDMLTWLWAGELLYAIEFFIWGSFFLIFPAWLLVPRRFTLAVFTLVLLGSITNFFTGPLSRMATKEPNHTHCGILTYAGVFYPLAPVLTQSHVDDLEARNQICWIKKMIQRVPREFENEAEFETFSRITQEKLLLPENKYRISLPFIAVLQGMILANYEMEGPMSKAMSGKEFVEGLKFWQDQYTVEISSRDYSIWDFPHGPYVKFEYGIIEKNWESIVDSIVVD